MGGAEGRGGHADDAGPTPPFVLALDGRSGSGKTVLSGLVTSELVRRGVGCTVVHLDDLYPGWSGLAAALPRLCAEVLAPLREGRTSRFTSWDWYADRPGAVREVPATEVVVVEGVGSGATACGALVDLVVWLEVRTQVRRRRALGRDGETFAAHWDGWATQEDAVFAARGGAGRADAVLHEVDGAATRALADRVQAAVTASGRGPRGSRAGGSGAR